MIRLKSKNKDFQNMLGCSDRIFAQFALKDFDLEGQLLAITSLLRRNSMADKALVESLKRLEKEAKLATGEYADHLADVFVDHCHGSIFQDAAHSMSAIGMICPFVESLFVAIFRGLRDRTPPNGQTPIQDLRIRSSNNEYWDPHYVFEAGGRRISIVEGIVQLASSTGLDCSLPASYRKTLEAMFEYRNKMFHNGFEWPMEERAKFEKRIVEKGWPNDWFSKSTTGSDPWIFYMSANFIEHCLEIIDQILAGVGAYIRHQEFGDITIADRNPPFLAK